MDRAKENEPLSRLESWETREENPRSRWAGSVDKRASPGHAQPRRTQFTQHIPRFDPLYRPYKHKEYHLDEPPHDAIDQVSSAVMHTIPV